MNHVAKIAETVGKQVTLIQDSIRSVDVAQSSLTKPQLWVILELNQRISAYCYVKSKSNVLALALLVLRICFPFALQSAPLLALILK